METERPAGFSFHNFTAIEAIFKSLIHTDLLRMYINVHVHKANSED